MMFEVSLLVTLSLHPSKSFEQSRTPSSHIGGHGSGTSGGSNIRWTENDGTSLL